MEILIQNGFMADQEYPPIKVISPNVFYAELLMDDFAGKESELTCGLQYMFHSYDTESKSKEISEGLRQIAMVEGYHQDVLAKLIVRLGRNPVYRAGYASEREYWNGSMVFYGRKIEEQLQMDLEQEYRSIRNYNTHIQMISDPNIKGILRRIILDEEQHILWLKRMLKMLNTEMK